MEREEDEDDPGGRGEPGDLSYMVGGWSDWKAESKREKMGKGKGKDGSRT